MAPVPTTMRAAAIDYFGGPEVRSISDAGAIALALFAIKFARRCLWILRSAKDGNLKMRAAWPVINVATVNMDVARRFSLTV